MPKPLPNVVTHLDIIKTVAVVLMIIDHIGAYFFPDNLWLRVLGRGGAAPVWMFLIGYALSRELPVKLFLGALALIVTDMFLIGEPFPLNILVLIILTRVIIDPVANYMLRTRYIFFISSVLMVLAFVATNLIVEYGTLGFMYALFGYYTRHRERLINTTFMNTVDYVGFGVFTYLSFIFLQQAQAGLDEVQFIGLAFLIAVEMIVLVLMKPMTFPKLDGKIIKPLLQFCGRRTLEIYVAHLVLFKVLAITIFVLK